MVEDFAAYAREHTNFLTPPICEHFEPRWRNLWDRLSLSETSQTGEIRDPETDTVLARFYTIDARVDKTQQTLPDIRQRIPALPQEKYPRLVVLMKNPDDSVRGEEGKRLNLGTRNAVAVITGADGQQHLWGVTPAGQIGRPWIGDRQLERRMIANMVTMQQALLRQRPLPVFTPVRTGF